MDISYHPIRSDLELSYKGRAVDDGEMDVYTAAGAMVAFSDFAIAAAKCVYGEKVEAISKVSGFRRGSFITQLGVQFGTPILGFFASENAQDLYTAITDAVGLWRHLRGLPPQSLSRADNGGVSIINHDGQVSITTIHAKNIVFNAVAGKAVEKFIAEPLSGEGMDQVQVTANGDLRSEVLSVSHGEAPWFHQIAQEEMLAEYDARAALAIETAVFKDGNKWRFSDGASSFWAVIADEEFLRRVDQGERFGKGDILIVDMHVVQVQMADKLVTERSILKVLEHKERPSQQTLLP
jgi:hypothetical protein